MLTNRKNAAAESAKIRVLCPLCSSPVVIDRDSVGFFVELVCPACGSRSYHDLQRSSTS